MAYWEKDNSSKIKHIYAIVYYNIFKNKRPSWY